MQSEDSRTTGPESPRPWLLTYAAVCAALLMPLYVYRASVLQRGGFIESLPAPILLVASALSIGVAMALWRSEERFVPWLMLAILCLVLVGEEASWGREAVMGRVLFPADEKWDFHNWLPQQVGGQIAAVDLNSWLGLAVVLIIGAIATGGALLATLKTIWDATIGLPQGFLLIAVVWVLLAMTVDFLDLTRVDFYNRIVIYKWAIEESSEIMAVTAVAFSALVRGHRHWRGG